MAESGRQERLAAILVADMAGFSRLMAADEHATISALDGARGVFVTCIESRSGRVVDMAGDAVLAVFPAAAGALNAALGVQTRLNAEALEAAAERRVLYRIGVHVGDVIEKPDGTVYGDGVNIAARLQALADPGGVCVSDAVRSAVRHRVEVDFEDLGDKQVKNIARAVRVFRVAVPPAEALMAHRASAPRNIDTARAATNVPDAIGRLVGREDDIAALERLLVEHRMVTIVGTGGIGKTRLAQAVARSIVDRYANGVWWVDLSALTGPTDIVPSIAAAARQWLGAGESAAQLARLLSARNTLIVLDNCEHLTPELATTAHAILTTAPYVRLLATSQQALRLEGEYCYRLDPLSVPPRGTALDAARSYGAVLLLEQRAQAIDRRFVLNGAAGDVALELCRQLDGIPLAIEMAAARLPTLGAESVRSRLAALRNASRMAPARQRTLRATLEWSYSLLDALEQAVLRRLAIFAGGFRIDIAQHVALADGDDESAVLDAVSGLVDRSLVQVECREPLRYRLLETMRTFATEQLAVHGEASTTARDHGSAMRRLGAEAERAFWLSTSALWLDCYAPEYPDLQAAFDYAVANQNPDVAAVCGEALLLIDLHHGMSAPSRRRIGATLALVPLAGPEAQARLWNCATQWLNTIPGRLSRLDAVNSRVVAWQRIGDGFQIHRALGLLAVEEARSGAFKAADATLAAMHAIEDPRWSLRQRWESAWCSGEVCSFRGDATGFADAYRQALEIAEEAGDDNLAQSTRIGLAEAALMSGDMDTVLTLTRPLIEQFRVGADASRLAAVLHRFCAASVQAGDVASARAAAIEIVSLHRQMDSMGWTFTTFSLLAARTGNAASGALLLGCADSWLDASAQVRKPVDALVAQLAATAIDAAIGPAERARLHGDGKALSTLEAEAFATKILEQVPVDLSTRTGA